MQSATWAGAGTANQHGPRFATGDLGYATHGVASAPRNGRRSVARRHDQRDRHKQSRQRTHHPPYKWLSTHASILYVAFGPPVHPAVKWRIATDVGDGMMYTQRQLRSSVLGSLWGARVDRDNGGRRSARTWRCRVDRAPGGGYRYPSRPRRLLEPPLGRPRLRRRRSKVASLHGLDRPALGGGAPRVNQPDNRLECGSASHRDNRGVYGRRLARNPPRNRVPIVCQPRGVPERRSGWTCGWKARARHRGRHPGADLRHTLREVCRRDLGIEVDKAEQASDWARRPLSAAQVRYAALDVTALLALRHAKPVDVHELPTCHAWGHVDRST